MVTFGSAGADSFGRLVHGGEWQARDGHRETTTTGFPRLDALLPAGGVRRGSLVEWLSREDGAGAATLACAVAVRVSSDAAGPNGRAVVVVDRSGWFHPPAVLPWLETGAEASAGGPRLLVARPSSDDDEIWAIDQSLRCAGVAAVVAWPRSRRQRPQAWATAMRRWQLAARTSGAIGLLVRPESAGGEPSWAETRIGVVPLAGGTLLDRRVRLSLVGGGWSGRDAAGATTEIAFDVARGCEAAAPREPRRAFVAGGVACRAS